MRLPSSVLCALWRQSRSDCCNRMDRADALRLVVFEYLLPANRDRRIRLLRTCLADERMDRKWHPSAHLAGIMEEIHFLSDGLLRTQGFPTSYVYPTTMRHANHDVNQRLAVRALVDSDGPLVWNAHCQRRADPPIGIRIFGRQWGGPPMTVPSFF